MSYSHALHGCPLILEDGSNVVGMHGSNVAGMYGSNVGVCNIVSIFFVEFV